MDFIEAKHELLKLSHESEDMAKMYADYRIEAAQAKAQLNILLASKYLSKFREKKSNIGLEMAYLMLVEEEKADSYLIEQYAKMLVSESKYLGLEKIIDAKKARMIAIQSIFKTEAMNT